MTEHVAWPPLPYDEWVGTAKTLHMVTQMLGKTRLALAPTLPQWLHTSLQLDARGFTTGAMPYASGIVTVRIDIPESMVMIERSDGELATVQLGDGRCVADIWTDYRAALTLLGIDVDLWEHPQEMTDKTPFSENRHDCEFDIEQALRFHQVLTSVNAVFEKFRSDFFGRSGVQFWWGSFDLGVLLFNGKKSEAPTDRGYIMRYDLDAEHMNAGFWPGDDANPSASFFGYIVPQPPGCSTAPVGPASAGWVEAMGEWLLSYEDVRTAEDPSAELMQFLSSIYGFAVTAAGWDAESHTYVQPPEPERSGK